MKTNQKKVEEIQWWIEDALKGGGSTEIMLKL
jgi:hypothetical protein